MLGSGHRLRLYPTQDIGWVDSNENISDEEIDKVKGSHTIVLNALRREKHPSHFNLEEAVQLAQEIGAKETYFTHISHQLGQHAEVEKELPDGMYIAYDGLKLEVTS
jgi:phosphoribosyl 1,2-cyclic phosphate phosphodiesterase